jgi:hypothetical protein
MVRSLETQTPEQIRSPEEIAQAFDYAQMAVGAMQRDPSFHASCADNGVNPQKDRHTVAYWDELRLYVGERTDKAREDGHDSLQMDTIDLLANTPNYLLEEVRLNQGESHSSEASHHGKEVTSHFNGLLRNFALAYPSASVNNVDANMLTMVNRNFHNRSLRTALASWVTPALRGARHELAFGQILEQADIPFRRAELEEDLKGVDYVVGHGADPLKIDVKASLTHIHIRNSEAEFRVRQDGQAVMHSLSKDAEFGDKFFIPLETAQDKAPYLLKQLEAVQNVRHQRRSA